MRNTDFSFSFSDPTFDAEGCPDDDIMEIAGNNDFVAPTANADSNGTLAVVTCVPVSGSLFSNPSTVVNCTATDSVLTGQEAFCSFTISVGASKYYEQGQILTSCLRANVVLTFVADCKRTKRLHSRANCITMQNHGECTSWWSNFLAYL